MPGKAALIKRATAEVLFTTRKNARAAESFRITSPSKTLVGQPSDISAAVLPAFASVRNPIDTTGRGGASLFRQGWRVPPPHSRTRPGGRPEGQAR